MLVEYHRTMREVMNTASFLDDILFIGIWILGSFFFFSFSAFSFHVRH